ncbi:hypothetical protein [Actinoplanes sp. NPDC051859]|uniref:hypothetical protein n=1 Tax=Actinoplanes sp. NPDC051859 TaxID=3363909 RepID=UPI0037A16AAE
MPNLKTCAAAAAAVASAAALTLSATPAQAGILGLGEDGVQLVVPVLAPMLPGQQGWISGLWTTDVDACNIKVTASAPNGVKFSYPTNTSTYTSLYVNSALAAHNVDFAALNVTVPPTVTSAVPVTLNVTYTPMAGNPFLPSDDLKTKQFTCTGTPKTKTVNATIPVAPPLVDLVQKTGSVTVPKITPTWTRLRFTGLRPDMGNFRVKLDAPSGLTVTYPGDGTSAGLNNAPTLPVGDDDYAAVRLDAGRLGIGIHIIPVSATWTGGSYNGLLTLVVT